MKKKIAILSMAVLLGLCVSACENSSAQSASSAQTEGKSLTATPKVTREAAEELLTIGTKTENSYEVKLENKTGKEIKGVYVKTTSQTEYGDNLMADSAAWAKGKKADIFYGEKSAESSTSEMTKQSTEASSQEFALDEGYDMKLVLGDDTEYVLHAFPCDDIEEGEVYIDEAKQVAYLKYDSLSTKEVVETKEAEIATKENEEAALAAQAEADSQAEAQAQQEAAQEAQAQAEAEAAAQAQAEAEAQAQAEAAAAAQPQYSYSSGGSSSSGSGASQQEEGCLG